MRAAIRLLVRFFLWFALITLVSSALVVADGYVTGYDPLGASTAMPLLPRLLTAVSLVWIPSVLAAAAIALSSAVRALTAPTSAITLLFLAWSATLVAGGLLLARYPAVDESVGAILPDRRLVRTGDLRLYALERRGETIDSLVVHDRNRDPSFGTVANVGIEPKAGELVDPNDDRFPIDLIGADNSYPAMARTPQRLAGIAADIRSLAQLLGLGAGLAGPLLNLAALSVFLVGSWTLVRLTRWPLFNTLFVLAALRFAIWLVPAVQRGVLRRVFIAAFDSTLLPYVSAAILAALGVGLLAILVFLPSLDSWRREVESD